MGLKLKENENKSGARLEDLSVGTVAVLQTGSPVIRVNEKEVQERGQHDERIYAINLRDGDIVLNPEMLIDKVFGQGDEITFEIRG